MRLNYYRFPDTVDNDTKMSEGCAVILKSGREIYPENMPDIKRNLIDHVDNTLGGISVTHAKQLLKKHGGSAWTEHCSQDGFCLYVTEITLKSNNCKIK